VRIPSGSGIWLLVVVVLGIKAMPVELVVLVVAVMGLEVSLEMVVMGLQIQAVVEVEVHMVILKGLVVLVAKDL
jgi:hypothetical protein